MYKRLLLIYIYIYYIFNFTLVLSQHITILGTYVKEKKKY